MYGDPFHLVLVFGNCSSQLSSHDVYAIITLEIATLDTPNKVAVAVTDVPAKRAVTMCPL
jgi:hypothetical protein